MTGESASRMDTKSSGRRVKHSRTGCVSCKERRLRCSEERPSCSRCLHDGRSCEYVLRLTWEDESSRRGVKHGRGKHAEVSFVDPTPPGELVMKSQWIPPQRRRRYFLNTVQDDMDGTQVQSVTQVDTVYATLRLYYTPPRLKLSVSDGMLYQYYKDAVCQTLTLVDDASNCYRQIVLPLSMSHECVRKSVLAVGALYLSLNQTSSTLDYYSLALQQKQRTLNQLRIDIASLNGESNNHILVSMLMLCLFDITDNCQTSWSTHVSAAANLLAIRGSQAPEPSLVSFVSKFFATRDVMGRSACGKRAKFREMAWGSPQEVDKATGCSSELLAIIASITDVSRQMVRSLEKSGERGKLLTKDFKADNQGAEASDLADRIIILEKQLDDLIQVLPKPDFNCQSNRMVLERTSSLVHNATKIYFYTSLRSALPSTRIVRHLVAEQIFLLQNMPTLQSAHLWSVFVTSLYALEDDERVFFLEQFDRLEVASATRSSTHAALAIVQTVWKRRDLDTDSEQSLDSGMTDWVKYVRPMSEGLSLA